MKNEILRRLSALALGLALLLNAAPLPQAFAVEDDTDASSSDSADSTDTADKTAVTTADSDPTVTAAAANAPALDATAALLVSPESDMVLYEKNADEKRYPASTTKIMTALLTLENVSDLSAVVTAEASDFENVTADSSNAGIKLGEQVTVKDLLYALMLPSANEAAYMLARHVGGSWEQFVDMMNERAAALGCTNTHFVNANGLPDPNHYTSAHDMALIMQECIKNETFCRIESDLTYTIQPTNMTSTPRDLQNHHALLFQDGQWGYKGAFAGKTGYTDEAHNTLVTAAKRGNMTLVCVVLTCDNLDYINDTRTVLDFGYDNFTHYTLKNAKKESLSGVVTLPKNAKIETATYTDPDGASVEEPYTRQYFFDDHFIGTAEVSAPGTVSDSSSVSSNSSEETDSTDIPTPEENKKISFLSTLLYILLGLNGVAFLILIIVVINNARKRRKRRNRRRNNRNKRH